jgi:hypothetical protein
MELRPQNPATAKNARSIVWWIRAFLLALVFNSIALASAFVLTLILQVCFYGVLLQFRSSQLPSFLIFAITFVPAGPACLVLASSLYKQHRGEAAMIVSVVGAILWTLCAVASLPKASNPESLLGAYSVPICAGADALVQLLVGYLIFSMDRSGLQQPNKS